MHGALAWHAMVRTCFSYGKLQASEEIPIIGTGIRMETISWWPSIIVVFRALIRFGGNIELATQRLGGRF